ncbi:hypothetical protein CC86DRAFT_452155 [Ophiobolus disseminans]|uniref:Uncharacterized protein n=1 Tax=Ophiobolus disseminans TaxID=1469910 RepID=A0A6A7AII0_9PLEO|nr:hypothetical protein CC86DRAFT_452155 [Ophiobolus disseminans]
MWPPFGIANANTTATWKSSSTERGTLDLLSSCIITLVLCVYSCLHLNIPEHERTRWYHKVGKQAIWILLGIFTPEMVTYIAFEQRVAAGYFERHMNEALFSTKPADRSEDIELAQPILGDQNHERFPWTRIHSHYVLMGGFVLDCSALGPDTFPGRRTRFTLTTAAVLKLAETEPSMIPDIDVEQICDKSKASNFIKFVVCTQATWFIVQVLGRLSTHCALSLLEVNTFAHALCCLAIYCFWWDKPMAIDTPTPIEVSGLRAQKICAWLLMASWSGASRPIYCEDRDKLVTTSWIGHLTYKPAEELSFISRDNGIRSTPNGSQEEAERTLMRLKPKEGLHGFYFTTATGPEFAFSCKRDWVLALSSEDVRCLALAQSLIEEDPIWTVLYDMDHPDRLRNKKMKQHLEAVFGDNPEQRPQPSKEYLVSHAFNFSRASSSAVGASEQQMVTGSRYNHWLTNWRRMTVVWFGKGIGTNGLTKELKLQLALGNSIIGTAYGAIHLLAWYAPFASKSEQILWRASGVITTCTVPFICLIGWLLFTVIAVCIWRSRDNYRRWLDRVRFNRFALYVLPFLASAFVVCYVFARLYLVLECFISLPYVPAGVYLQPQWSRYIPHFGAR